MADLQARKIPVLTGINDIPSSLGQANHPNDSLLCKNYNDLIDDLESALSAIESDNKLNSDGYIEGNYYWVDNVNGNNTNDGINNPFATLDHFFEVVKENKTYKELGIYLSGTFTNPILNFSVLPLQSSYSYASGVGGNTIYVMGFDNGQGSTIVVDNDFHALGQFATQFVRSKVVIEFSNITFKFNPDSALLLDNVPCIFSGCTFDFSDYSPNRIPIVVTNSSYLSIGGITVVNPNNISNLFLANNSNVEISLSLNLTGITNLLTATLSTIWDISSVYSGILTLDKCTVYQGNNSQITVLPLFDATFYTSPNNIVQLPE